MIHSAGHISPLALRYANALLDLANVQGCTDQVEQSMLNLETALDKSDDFQYILKSPLLDKDSQSGVLKAIGVYLALNSLTLQFLFILCTNGRLGILGQVITAFKHELAEQRGQMTAYVQTCQDMTSSEIKSLQEILQTQTGVEIVLDITVNPDILGGLIVTIGSYQVDASVIGRLSQLKVAMSKPEAFSVNDNGNRDRKKAG